MRHRTIFATLIVVLFCGALFSATPTAANSLPTPDVQSQKQDRGAIEKAESASARETRTARAKTIQRLSMSSFGRLAARGRAGQLSGVDAGFDWQNNGCSTPPGYPSVWRRAFTAACVRHDFGYRNFGHGWYREAGKPRLALDISNSQKDYTDAVLANDMDTICENIYPNDSSCGVHADAFYASMSFSAAHNAWHNSECIPGFLCLFKNKNFEGKRYSYSEIVRDLGSFNDEPSSLLQNSSYAWSIFEDREYRGDSKCFSPRAQVADLHAIGYGDEISSLAPRRSC